MSNKEFSQYSPRTGGFVDIQGKLKYRLVGRLDLPEIIFQVVRAMDDPSDPECLQRVYIELLESYVHKDALKCQNS